MAGDRIRAFEDRSILIPSRTERKIIMKRTSLRTHQAHQIPATGVLQGEEKEAEKIFEEIMAKTFQNLMENFYLHFQEAQ